ncbi:MAG: HAMP domain-containing methyl-accepting chemotaxis protein [Alphaproteobacteria bacterium]|nr:HAMP domain-containing methyl-accepting chemotaxis protein [Alphaproteobacteria bacterium]
MSIFLFHEVRSRASSWSVEIDTVNYINALYRSINNLTEENYVDIIKKRGLIERDLHMPTFEADKFKSSPVERLRIIYEDVNDIKDDLYINLDPEASANYLALLVSDNVSRMLYSSYEIAYAINSVKSDGGQISQVIDAFQQFDEDLVRHKDVFNLAKEYSDTSDVLNTAVITLGRISDYNKELRKNYNAKTEGSGIEVLRPILNNTQALGVSLSNLMIEGLKSRERLSFIKIAFGLILGLVGMITSIGFVYMIIIGVADPITLVTRAMEKFANGDITTKLPVYDRRDEVGKMTNALNRFHSTLVEREKLLEDKRKHSTQEEKRAQALFVLNKEFEKLTRESLQIFAGASEELNITAKSMADAANVASQRSSVVASASEEISQNINSVASSSKGLVNALQVIGSQVETSQKTTKIAVNEANESIVLINNLSDAANKIGNIVGLINSIASQTNLLALNATIEAARAGDAGRGFAVVAGEVKSLASQTAQATDEISTQINTMQNATGIVVSTIERISGTIQKINHIADEIQESIQREKKSTVEIAQSVDQVAINTNEVSSNINDVSSVVSQTSSAAAQVLNSSQSLNEQAHLLKKQIDEYLSNVTEA